MSKISSIISGCLLFICIFLHSSVSEAESVTDQLKGTLIKLLNTLNDPAFKSPDTLTERNRILHGILKERFDEEALSRGALGRYWEKISVEEKNEFIPVFSAVLEETYFSQIDTQLKESSNVSIDNILFINEAIKGDYAQVSTKIMPGDGSEIPVIYRLKNNNGKWMVVDMAIEGVIITKNYRSQFNEILSRESFSELIKRLKEKQKARPVIEEN